MNNTTQSIALTSEFSDLVVDLDPSTGAPLRLSSGGHTLELQCRVRLITEGLEARAAAGGLDYVDTIDVFLAPNGVDLINIPPVRSPPVVAITSCAIVDGRMPRVSLLKTRAISSE